MVTVHQRWGENDAELIRSVLSTGGIESQPSRFAQASYPLSVNSLGRIELDMTLEDVERAMQLIEANPAD